MPGERPCRVLRFGGNTVELYAGHTRTVLADGTVVWAVPHDTDDYRATAARLGCC